MNGANKVLSLNQNLILTSALNLNGANGGFINPLTNSVVIGNGAALNGGSPISYVITNANAFLVKRSIGSSPFKFAIGTGTNYAPVTFNDANNTNDSISAYVLPRATLASFTPTPLPSTVQSFAGFQWFVSEGTAGGSNAALSFEWPTSAVVNPPMNTNGQVLNYNGTSWSRTTGTFIGNTISTSGYSNFTSFAVVKDPVQITIDASVDDTLLCEGDNVTVTITPSDILDPGNVFTVQLSDASGSFATPRVLGTLNSSVAGNVLVTIPAGVIAGLPGTGFKIRVVSSAPIVLGNPIIPTITINPLPVTPIVTNTLPLAFCLGDSTVLFAPGGFANYRWSNGATTQTITVKTSGSFYVIVANANGCVSDTSAIVSTVVTDPGIAPVVTVTGSQIICPGDSVVLSGPASGNYVWSTGATTQRIVVRTAGTYYLRLQVGACLTDTSNIVAVTNAPVPTTPVIIVQGGRPTTFCSGDSVILEGPAGGVEYRWSTGANTQRITIFSSNPGITLQVRFAVGACISDTSVAVPVTVNQTPDQPAITYTNSDSVSCVGAPVVIEGPAGYASYLWSGPTTLPNTQQVDVIPTGPGRTAYTLRVVSAAGCTSLVSRSVGIIAIPPPANVSLNNLRPLTFCEGDSTILEGDAGIASYEWTINGVPGPTTQRIVVKIPAVVTLRVSNAEGCFSVPTNPVTVTVNAVPGLPTITSSTGSFSFCQGSTITLSGPAGLATYKWLSASDVVLSTTQNLDVSTAGNVKLIVTNALGCSSDTASANIIVNTIQQVTVIPAGNAIVCSGGTITLSADGFPANARFVWAPNGETTPSITVGSAGAFSVTVTDANGCSSTSAVTNVTVSTPPTVTISPDTFRIAAGKEVPVTVGVSPAGNYTYQWAPTFGVSDPNAASVTITASEPTDYTVTVTDIGNCSNSKTIRIIATKELFVPNMFSPNGDGINDVLKVYGYGVVSLKLRIYDRYGRTVFESSNAEYIQNTGWDGTDGGNKLPSDNYFFAISGKLENGQDIKIDGKNNGSIFLNR